MQEEQTLEVETNQRERMKEGRKTEKAKEMSQTILTTFSLIVWHKLLIIVRYLS